MPIGLAIAAVALVGAVAVAASSGMFGGASATPSPAPSVATIPTASPSLAVTPSPSPVVTAAPTPTPVPTPTPTPGGRQARITGITVSNGAYLVDYDVFNFSPDVLDRHIHFFFDTIPPDQAGTPAKSSNWILYDGPVPFDRYKVSDRPTGASQMCVLVARHDHSVIQNTGNCFDLPS